MTTENKMLPRDTNLPCPRFELRWEMTGSDWRERECVYSLVIPIRPYDARAEVDDSGPVETESELRVALGLTICGGGDGKPPIHDGIVDTPYRDHAHSQWACEGLGGTIPIVAVCGDVHSIIDLKVS